MSLGVTSQAYLSRIGHSPLAPFRMQASLGSAQFAMDYAVQYVKSRQQFGKVLVEFQTVQFRLVECHSLLMSARTMLHSAAQSWDSKVRAEERGPCTRLRLYACATMQHIKAVLFLS